MPILDTQKVQRELQQGMVWPVYWIYGPETLKVRELVKQIRLTVLGQIPLESSWRWNEQMLEGSQLTGFELLDQARCLPLGHAVQWICVRDAHLMVEPEGLLELCGPAQKKDLLHWVCVFISKDLDGRKKFSKQLQAQAAVVPCEAVKESERAAWVDSLAQARGISLKPEWVDLLCLGEMWSLESIDQELEKIELSGLDPGSSLQERADFLDAPWGTGEVFLDAFFKRNLQGVFPYLLGISQSVDRAFPLLGLLGWNVRQLALCLSDREQGTHAFSGRMYGSDRIQRWSGYWKLQEVIELQQVLKEMDWKLKQSPVLALGVWDQLVFQFCKAIPR